MSEHPAAAALMAFVGPNSAYYLRAWQPRIAGEGLPEFNWAAFFFPIAWLGYRKMYGITALVTAAIVATTVLEELLFVGEPPMVLDLLTGLVVAVVCGRYGNAWYLNRAKRRIESAYAEAEVHRFLRQGGTTVRQGGTTVVGALLCSLLSVVAAIAPW